jgi:hypothetical protein
MPLLVLLGVMPLLVLLGVIPLLVVQEIKVMRNLKILIQSKILRILLKFYYL